MTRKCCVSRCNNSEWQRKKNKQQNITFHMFPADHVLNSIWCDQIKAANNDKVIHGNVAVVCSAHFRESDFKFRKNGQRGLLVSSAVPSIFEQSEIDQSTTYSSPPSSPEMPDMPDEFIVSFEHGNISVVKSNSNVPTIASVIGSVNGSTSTSPCNVSSANVTTNVSINMSPTASANVNPNAERTIWIRDLKSMTATYPGISDGIIISPTNEPELESSNCSNVSNGSSVNVTDSLAGYVKPIPRKRLNRRVIRYPGDIADTMEMSPDTLRNSFDLCKSKIKSQAKEIYHLKQKVNRQRKQIEQLKEQLKGR